jgi:hypothetical protein
MIPSRLPSNAIFGHEMKLRVTACRKRLRTRRSLHKVPFTESEAFTSGSVTSFPDACAPVRESLPGGGNVAEFREREAWPRPDQEVGIT